MQHKGFITALCIAGFTLAPVAAIMVTGAGADPGIWDHLAGVVLPELVFNSVILVSGVISLTAFLGISLAWLTALHEFPGRAFFEKALLFPLAIPAYVMAFIYTGLLDFSGPVQTWLRSLAPGAAAHFPEIRSAWGVVLVIALSLFPYVFLMAGTGFRSMGPSMMEAARILGSGRLNTLLRVIIPMARPWIFGGLVLVFMETLADFGAVSIFNFDTFTTAIYKAWYGFFSIESACALAAVLVLVVLILFAVESRLRRQQRFFTAHARHQRTVLGRGPGLAACGYATLVFGLAFAIPVLQLGIWTLSAWEVEFNLRYLNLTASTFGLGAMGTGVTMVTALVLAYSVRRQDDTRTAVAAKLSLSGYALPGTVLAVGMIQMVALADQGIAVSAGLLGFTLTAPVLQGAVMLLPLCYMIRFITAGYNALAANYTRIMPAMDEAARILKTSEPNLFLKIHLPLIRPGLFTGAVMVMVEIIKELPVTLMLRPFGWDTLAVKIFELTSEGEWKRAALPALTLVIFGMLPIFLLTRMGDKR